MSGLLGPKTCKQCNTGHNHKYMSSADMLTAETASTPYLLERPSRAMPWTNGQSIVGLREL